MTAWLDDPGAEQAGLRGHELRNARGDRVGLLNFGARITRIELGLRGGPRTVTLAYPRPADYVTDPYFLGATVGRYCNRIRNARFEIAGTMYPLPANDGPHQLHGGTQGFFRRYWNLVAGATEREARFSLASPDGEEGYPGELRASVRFEWNDDRELTISYAATADRPTHVNLSNHSYFNLDGGGEDVLGHAVQIRASRITAVDGDLLPTGELPDVGGTVLDLRHERVLRDLACSEDERVRRAQGADFNYVLDGGELAAVVTAARGDLRLELRTSCPGLQLYSGQHLRAPFRPFQGLCLETQYFPDSPNMPAFPSTLLVPGQRYEEMTVYRFLET